jgi:hypothetical protein
VEAPGRDVGSHILVKRHPVACVENAGYIDSVVVDVKK